MLSLQLNLQARRLLEELKLTRSGPGASHTDSDIQSGDAALPFELRCVPVSSTCSVRVRVRNNAATSSQILL